MLQETKQIKILREMFEEIKSIDPDGNGYKNLIMFLDKQPQNLLKDLVAANIKWVSSLARNRLDK